MTDVQFWFVTLIFILAFALICAGFWIKFGPELAMIVAGFLLAWFVSAAFNVADKEKDKA